MTDVAKSAAADVVSRARELNAAMMEAAEVYKSQHDSRLPEPSGLRSGGGPSDRPKTPGFA
jgi:hypothetical protein